MDISRHDLCSHILQLSQQIQLVNSSTFEPGFIFMSPEVINSRLIQMLWLKFECFEFEPLWHKFDCNFELIKVELTQRCLMSNLYMVIFKRA